MNQTQTQHSSEKWVFKKKFSIILIQHDLSSFKSSFNYVSVLNLFPQDVWDIILHLDCVTGSISLHDKNPHKPVWPQGTNDWNDISVFLVWELNVYGLQPQSLVAGTLQE